MDTDTRKRIDNLINKYYKAPHRIEVLKVYLKTTYEPIGDSLKTKYIEEIEVLEAMEIYDLPKHKILKLKNELREKLMPLLD